MSAAETVTLTTGNRAVSGWLDVAVTRGIERCPSDFVVHFTERYPGEADAVVVTPGEACTVKLGADVIVTGYVDALDIELLAGQHILTIRGRGKCADLVDCPAIWPGCQIVNSSALATATKLTQPYGVMVSAVAADALDPVPLYVLRWGETAYAVIEEICRFRGLLAYDVPDGNLVLAQVGTEKHVSALVEGENIQEARVRYDVSQRYSEYTVRRLGMDYFADTGEGGNLLEVVTDTAMAGIRYRPYWLVAEQGDDGAVAKQRALWECARRAGRSQVLEIVTDSWRDRAGRLYEPNMRIDVDVPSLKIRRRELLIAEVSYLRGESGSTAKLRLMPADAFRPEPILLMPTFADVPAL